MELLLGYFAGIITAVIAVIIYAIWQDANDDLEINGERNEDENVCVISYNE